MQIQNDLDIPVYKARCLTENKQTKEEKIKKMLRMYLRLRLGLKHSEIIDVEGWGKL